MTSKQGLEEKLCPTELFTKPSTFVILFLEVNMSLQMLEAPLIFVQRAQMVLFRLWRLQMKMIYQSHSHYAKKQNDKYA